MPNVLIRDVPEDVLAAIDAKARRAGLSRTEYIRRTLCREGNEPSHEVSVDDLTGFSRTCADLDDPDVMSRAWS